jgi:hypothetical protein
MPAPKPAPPPDTGPNKDDLFDALTALKVANEKSEAAAKVVQSTKVAHEDAKAAFDTAVKLVIAAKSRLMATAENLDPAALSFLKRGV